MEARIDLSRPVRLDLEHEERLGSADGFEKRVTEIELRVDVHDMLQLAGSYRLSVTAEDGVWHRASGDAKASYEVARLSFAYRLRLQSSYRPDGTVSMLRNKIGASYELGKRVEPFAAFESHYSRTNSEFRENRLVLGSEVRLSKRIELEAYYMYQNEFNKRIPERNHVLGLGLSFRLRKAKKSKEGSGGTPPVESIAMNGLGES